MHVFKLPLGTANSAVIVADETMGSGIMGCCVTDHLKFEEVVAQWAENWKVCFGESPTAIVADEAMAPVLIEYFQS